MAGRPADVDPEPDGQGAPPLRDGHETLLPSVTRSALSTRIPVIARLDPSGFQDLSETPPPVRTDDRPRGARAGDVIGGRYTVEGQLGRGGMGRVMRVRHLALGKVFALKLIRSSIATNPKIREMFYREARLASALTHDNICSIVDFGQDEAFGLFMVMELLEGQTVHGKLRHGRLSPKVGCDILWQVADAVRFIHSRAIVHGDIKTENIFLMKTAVQRRLVKLLDFGLARPDLGRREGIDGTPEYLAPERQDGAPASQASDIYALGIVFFELLTGHVPFSGAMADVLVHHKLTEVPAPSAQLSEPLDERADALVRRATAKDPASRHPDVAAFLYELRALMGMLGMDHSRRRTLPTEARERRDPDHRVKAAAELFAAAPIPMAACDPDGRIRTANPAFLEFLGVAGDAVDLQLRDSALPDLYPELFADLEQVATQRRQIKRIIYLHEGDDRIVEAAVLMSAAPTTAEVTAGQVHLVLHPLRARSA
ncbi:MAG TPA: protein kinase [Kofleriaceae bacterium]|jgi:serine/threonine protein kinase|nr:protein kinase [Kofleriaceae bacterium]